MATTKVKKGDTGVSLLRQLYQGGTAFDVSATKYRVLVSGEDDDTGTAQYSRRDVTTNAKANGTPAEGKLAIPIWDGRTAPGTLGTVTIVDYTTNGKVNVTVAASGGTGGTITQELYRTEGGGSTYYLLASFADGLYSASPYVDNMSDATLVAGSASRPPMNPHSDDQSATITYSALPAAPTPTCALAGAGAGVLDNAVYNYKVVNKRASDTDTVGLIRWEIIIRDDSTGGDITFPEGGFEYLSIQDDVS